MLAFPLLSASFSSQHKFIAFGIHTHRQMGRFISFGLRFAGELAAGSDNLLGTGNNIRNLKTHARPSPFPLSPAMDTDGGTAHRNLADDFGCLDYFSTENLAIESHGAFRVGRPDHIFHTFDVHSRQ